MTAPQASLNKPKIPPYKLAGLVLAIITAVVFALTWMQFRGSFEKKAQLTVLSGRAGLSMDPGSKVTFNGVPIGRLASIDVVTVDDNPEAKLTLDVKPQYLKLIPENVTAELRATTVFGNKYISFLSPSNPSAKRLTPDTPIRAQGVTTEFNTLFETITAISEQIDPIKLNQTLTATAQALDGLGDKFGQSIVNGNDILADLNPRMPQIRRDTAGLADLGEVYANAAPDLFDGLTNAVTTARTLNEQRGNLDQALVAAVGFGNTGGDIFERGGPYLVRGAQDLLPTSALLDKYSPALFCTIRNYHDAGPKLAGALGGNGYSLQTHSLVVGVGNPYVYPDNLPRVNAKGGPEGRPGCWQPVTKDLWPMPYLVMDTGASIAPYNHLELGQPLVAEYVWGRQVGENTINP
ncbi:MCE-family protein MCE1A [Mycolicibacterium peregrinum]|jgi:phospholipid/cholesterol/gamma-HCH transport system substrate-binding protein|uniref:MCE-family protein MCE1A n=4 Tax=Mycolicibacterium TaxID=1866885 RepID=A0A0J8UAU3_9MYCO|nr:MULTISPECIES: MCE family protein [Mycolicibacterium]KMV18107.1 MCE-family protein MCE1A [Mycolicibacterium conceptionense]MCV7204560.1 MCE family protein [Mycolicibacterium peregrinum]MCW1823713.1 MCE family protein [Mycolicibacterium senegalense]OBB03721.1 MCE-family protein MCE1A [Mycolicibacterium conceptionense]OBF01445.1 MCE-family protein MCE1A [Mycolicibacterium conceptionense]